MGGHLAIQGDLAQLDLAVFPACGSRDLSGSTDPLPGIHSCFSAWNTFATASLDHSSPSRHRDRSCGVVKRCSDALDSDSSEPLISECRLCSREPSLSSLLCWANRNTRFRRQHPRWDMPA